MSIQNGEFAVNSGLVGLPRRDTASIEFQGGLVKLSYASAARGIGEESAFHDYHLFKRFYAQAFRDCANKLPPDKRVYDAAGNLTGAELSADELAEIESIARGRVAAWLDKRGKRARIKTFSKSSRRRLLRMLARLRADVRGLFLTFTYRENMQDHELAKEHLDKLKRWLKRRFSGCAIVWRMEYQRRGAIHFHMIVFGGKFIDAAELTRYWQKLTHDDSYPDVETLNGRRHVLAYVSKYLAKVHEDEMPPPLRPDEDVPQRFSEERPQEGAAPPRGGAGLDNEPYSEISEFVGRFWGMVNKELMPYADGVRVAFDGDARFIAEFRRYVRRFWRRLSMRIQGFSLFCDAEQWLRLWRWALAESDLVVKVSEDWFQVDLSSVAF